MSTPTALYHFTSGHHLPGIMSTGLTKGVLPWKVDAQDRVGFVPGWQWLTTVGDWSQEWARPSPFSRLAFRRDEIRITVTVPVEHRSNLVSWPDLDTRYRPASREFLNTFAESRHWFAFHGAIPHTWFLAIERNPYPEQVIDPTGN